MISWKGLLNIGSLEILKRRQLKLNQQRNENSVPHIKTMTGAHHAQH